MYSKLYIYVQVLDRVLEGGGYMYTVYSVLHIYVQVQDHVVEGG